jgi:MFS family permease
VSDPSASSPSLRRVLVSTASATTAGVLPAFLIGAQAVQLRRDLSFSAGVLGVVVALTWLGAAIASAPMGRVAERIGGSVALRLAAATNGLVMLTMAVVTRSWVSLALLGAVAAVGNALTQPAANLVLARTIPPERYGIAFAVKQSAMPFGTLVAGLAVPVLTLTLGWRWAFAAAGALALVAAASIPRTRVADSARVAELFGASDGAARQRPQLDTPGMVLAVLALGVGLGAATASALASFLVSGSVAAGLREASAGLLLTFGSLLGIASRLLQGTRADRRGSGHLRVVAFMLSGGAAAFAFFALAQPWAYVVGTPLAFAAGWAWPGLFNLAVVRANPGAPGLATAVTQTGTYLGAGLGPLLFGIGVDRFGYSWAWLATAVAALLAAAAVATGRRRLRALGLSTGRLR